MEVELQSMLSPPDDVVMHEIPNPQALLLSDFLQNFRMLSR